MKIFEIKKEWTGPCAKTINPIVVDCGDHSCIVSGDYGTIEQEPEKVKGKFFIKPAYNSSITITPVANDGFYPNQNPIKLPGGPKRQEVKFTFTEGQAPEPEKKPETDPFNRPIEENVSPVEEILFLVKELHNNQQLILAKLAKL